MALYSFGVPQVDGGDVEGAERVVADMRSEPVAPNLSTCVYILDNHIGIADGVSIARVWACRYSK